MPQHTLLNHHLRELIDRELDADETVLWTQQPIPRFFTGPAIAAFLFSIPWTAFAVFWVFAAPGFQTPTLNGGQMGGQDLFPLFGIPFVLVGLGMMSAPIWAYRAALNTVYLITDQRDILVEGGFKTRVRSSPPPAS